MTHRSVKVTAFAKLNLGLEILGKRADGYHDLVTVMQTVSLEDFLTLSRIDDGLSVEPLMVQFALDGQMSPASLDDSALQGQDNLAVRAVRLLGEELAVGGVVDLRLRKRIPVAAGLGGASANAAAALLGACELWSRPVASETLARLAIRLGSDVPFFLRTGTALVTGRGECVKPLPDLRPHWFVIVSPVLSRPIPRKTVSLYQALCSSDFSNGEVVGAVARRIAAGEEITADPLPNGFVRALYHLRTELASIPEAMMAAGATSVALSGAGPSHYAVERDAERASWVASRIESRLGAKAFVTVCQPVKALTRKV